MPQPLPTNSPNRTLASLLVIAFLSIPLFLPAVPPASGSQPIQVKQGEVVLLPLQPGPEADAVTGKFSDQEVYFYKTADERYVALLGIDLDQAPGRHSLEVTWKKGDAFGAERLLVEVLPASFATQHLKLPKAMVDLDPPTLARVGREQSRLKEIFDVSVPRKLWEGNFVVPVEGKIAGTFGLRRVMNGQPRNPHTGEDIGAAEGTPVVASNRGKVILVGDFYFNGRSVIIDHGLGLFSMYFHLLNAAVQEGETVEKGAQIGAVGQSGRATGPHLHWGMRLNGARVNPFSLIGLDKDR